MNLSYGKFVVIKEKGKKSQSYSLYFDRDEQS